MCRMLLCGEELSLNPYPFGRASDSFKYFLFLLKFYKKKSKCLPNTSAFKRLHRNPSHVKPKNKSYIYIKLCQSFWYEFSFSLIFVKLNHKNNVTLFTFTFYLYHQKRTQVKLVLQLLSYIFPNHSHTKQPTKISCKAV